jgi:hypothetical protein
MTYALFKQIVYIVLPMMKRWDLVSCNWFQHQAWFVMTFL